MELRISRRTLRRVTRGLLVMSAVLAVTVGLYAIGLRLTPRTERGRPILYSPAVRAAVTYQSRVTGWLADLRQIDQVLDQLVTNSTTDLYTQSARADESLGQVLQIAQAVAVQMAPTSLAEVQRQMTAISLAYHQAAQQAAAFVAAPTPERLNAATADLQQARALAHTLENSRWFQAAQGATWANQ
jgi:hypothetical protein